MGRASSGMFWRVLVTRAALGWALAATAAAAVAGSQPQAVPMAQVAVAHPPDRPLERAELETFFDGVMGAQFAAHKLAGAVILAVKDDGILFEKGYGFADLEHRVPVDPERTTFTVGSISKLFTWTAVMQLVEQGKLDLDADLNRYLVKFKIPASYPTPITMRHLLTHTAGFADVGAPFAPETFRRSPSLGDFLAAHLPARAMPPASDFTHAMRPYSNWGALLGGYIVECVSGEPYREYVARHILQPLAMSTSDFASSRTPDVGQRALGYVFANGRMVGQREDMSSSGPAGALLTTAADMSRFMIAHLATGAAASRILSEQSLQTMHRRSAQASPYLDGVALGFMDGQINGRRVLSHEGSTQFAHSELLLFPESRLGLFVAYNSVEGGYAVRELRRAFADHYLPAGVKPAPAVPAHPVALAEYSGGYQSLRRSFTTFEKLFGAVPIGVSALANGRLLIGGEQWTAIASDIFENRLGERVAFARANARVVALSFKSSLVPAVKIHWYQDPKYHALALVLILLSALGAIVSAIRGLRSQRNIPTRAARARWLLALLGTLILCATLVLISVLAAGIGPIMSYGIPTRLYVGLTLALLAAVLTPIAVVLVGLTLRETGVPRRFTLWQLVHCGAAVLFVLLLNYWNLLGFKFG